MKRTSKIGVEIRDSILLIVLLAFLLVPISEVYSQDKSQKPSRQSALEAFSKGDFELAYSHFTELSAIYPKDPLYKYYCGVCLVKLNRDPARSATLLLDAIHGSAAIRSVPPDGLFYLGRAQQMCGEFTEAIKTYNSYTVQVGKKISRDAGVSQFVQQCIEKKGQITTIGVQTQVLIRKDSINKPPVIIVVPKVEKTIQKPVDSLLKQKALLPQHYDTLLSQALDYQFKTDSLSSLASQIRKKMEMADNAEKSDLKIKAQNLEQQASSNQKIADSTMTLSVEKYPQRVKDSVIVIKEKQPEILVVLQAATQVQKVTEIFSVFDVVAKPVYKLNEKVAVNPEVPPGLIYRIQLAVFRNPVVPSYFKGITPVFGFKNTGTELTNYYAGMFRKSADAAKALIRIKALGFKDAFVVALSDKIIVSADRAGILEKEWGTKPLSVVKQTTDIPHDTIPPTLVFRVEVIKSIKPLVTDKMENIKKLAGSRGLEIIVNESKQNIYLIGKFLTFESAAEYADLLVRNGLSEAKVVAYLGKREIPVDTARQLFEK